jgi:hypothetical protein
MSRRKPNAHPRPRRFFHTRWGRITLFEFARKLGVPYTTLRHRIDRGLVRVEPAPPIDYITHNPAYWSWASMHARCRHKSSTGWKNYGGRGIAVCPEWGTFEQFWADMGSTYQPGLTIERKDNDKGYCPGNCEWIPRNKQNKNRRANRYFDTPQGRLTLTDTARLYGLNEATLRRRLKAGLTLADAISFPPCSGLRYTRALSI